jgi:predicted permease
MNVLVATEVALAMILLVVGGLSSLDIWRLGQADPGFNAERVMTYRLSLPSSRYPDSESHLGFFEAYAGRLNSLPGVESATLATSLPLAGRWGWLFEAEGVVRAPGENSPVVLHRVVYPGYFETMDVTILEGRGLNQYDGREEGTQAVVVNESFVRSHLEGTDDPIGRRIRSPGDGNPWMTVVGVAQDVRHYGVDEEPRPGVYQPLRQLPLDEMYVALRTTGDPVEIMAQARTVTAEMDTELPMYQAETMSAMMEESLWTRRATSWIIATFSGIALLLAVAGLYGVISYSVGQRRKEISIRMALGAQGEQVRWQVLRQGVGIVLVGVAIGLTGALAGAQLVSGILVDVSARNPMVYLGVTLLLLLVAAAANYLPARRAASLEPAGVLRD